MDFSSFFPIAASWNPLVWIKELHALMMAWAESEGAVASILGITFAESSFFPLPVDPMLIVWCVNEANRPWAIWMGLACGLVSTLGGMFGYGLGRYGGRPMLVAVARKRWLGWLWDEKKLETVDRIFEKYGMWAVVIAGWTPVPYKVFTITAGAARMRFGTFVLASTLSRIPRFFLEGVLLYYLGAVIQKELETRGELWYTLTGGLVIVGFIAIKWLKPKKKPEAEESSPAEASRKDAKEQRPQREEDVSC